jgi:hypothetical protein
MKYDYQTRYHLAPSAPPEQEPKLFAATLLELAPELFPHGSPVLTPRRRNNYAKPQQLPLFRPTRQR